MTPRIDLVRRADGHHVAVVREPAADAELTAIDLRELALALLDAAATIDHLEHRDDDASG